MLSYARRFAFASSPLLLVLAGLSDDASEPKPSPKQIAQWVEQLGDNSFKAREDASKRLWQTGAAAESALEKAVKSDDREVARRARELLDKFRWGIYPDTPADIVALIHAYRSREGNPRLEVIKRLLDSGDAGLRAVLKIAAAEKDDDQRKVLGDVVVDKLPAAYFLAVTQGKYEQFERLLEFGHTGKFIAQNQYAAYWLLRRKLPERIAHFTARLREHPDDKWLARTLAYLHRANGNLVAARKAAEKSERADLLEGILYEIGDWKALAARPVVIEGEKLKHGKGRYIIERPINPASGWTYHAAFARLAGDQKEFDKAVSELRKFAEGAPDFEKQAFIAAKGLLLNDRPADGLELLRTVPDRRVLLFDILCARLDFAAALKLAAKEIPNDNEISDLGLARARLLCLLGEKAGERLFDRFADRIEDGIDPKYVQSLLNEEMRAGLKDRAFVHAAKAMNVAPPKVLSGAEYGMAQLYVAQLFPQQAATAKVWWTVLRRQLFKGEPTTEVLNRLRNLMEGKVAAKEVKMWIERAEQPWINSLKVDPHWCGVLAEAAILAGLDQLASSLLEKAEGRDSLLRLGDLLAAKKQWDKAAQRYQRAWEKVLVMESERGRGMRVRSIPERASHDPLPLYLAGDALIRAGREKEGKELIEQAHWIPFADAAARFNFITALAKRGHKEAARRETELMLRVSEPNTYHSNEAIHHLALDALVRKDHLKAAEGLEQSTMRCYKPGINFTDNSAYARFPARIHQLRASALLAAGKLDEALKHVELALGASPGYANLPIMLVPELERRGHKKDSTDLFNRCYGIYEKVCSAYPRYALAHNEAAWISVCCRRNLDAALRHAQKAVELVPTHAGYFDTLAEVHFQRGDRDKAITLQKRAIELNPKRAYYRKQLKRLERGDPSAERPPDNDEE